MNETLSHHCKPCLAKKNARSDSVSTSTISPHQVLLHIFPEFSLNSFSIPPFNCPQFRPSPFILSFHPHLIPFLPSSPAHSIPTKSSSRKKFMHSPWKPPFQLSSFNSVDYNLIILYLTSYIQHQHSTTSSKKIYAKCFKCIYTTFVFLGMGYLTQDDCFQFFPFICKQNDIVFQKNSNPLFKYTKYCLSILLLMVILVVSIF